MFNEDNTTEQMIISTLKKKRMGVTSRQTTLTDKKTMSWWSLWCAKHL